MFVLIVCSDVHKQHNYMFTNDTTYFESYVQWMWSLNAGRQYVHCVYIGQQHNYMFAYDTYFMSHMFVERKPSALSDCTFSEQAPFLAKSHLRHQTRQWFTDHVAVHCQPAHPLLSSTELKIQISSGSDSFQFFHSSKMFANNTKLL